MRENFTYGCVSSECWRVQWEVSPTGAKVRSPVTWIARRKETESLKPIDQIILWDDSEPLGRNESERRCGLESEWPQRPSRQLYGEGSMDGRT
jgi:hypothetical protein